MIDAPPDALAQTAVQIDTESLGSSLKALLIAFLLAFPLAWNRERGPRRMGLRTMPLVAVSSCAYVLVGAAVAGDDPNSLSRIVQGLITGIGFIGGGAILKSEREVKGASTAAAIWATGAVGAAVATGRLELAIAVALLTFVTFLVLTPIRERIRDDAPEEEAAGDG